MVDPRRLDEILARRDEVVRLMAHPDVATDPARLAALGREGASLREVAAAAEAYRRLVRERDDLRTLVEGEEGEMAALAQAELGALEEKLPALEAHLERLLIPKDPEDARDAIVEIRAGTGGDEAALFAGDLFEIYQRFAAEKGWRVEVMDASAGAMGGFKEVVFAVKGPDAYGTLKYESGVHRVQRVPATESQGRIHTSAATVAVLPEAEEVDVEVRPQDVEVDVYRSSGPGGQSVNTTDSAVRLTHKPTGLVVTCQDEKSQLKNKEKAMRVLRARLYQMERDRLHAERADARRQMVGSGDRSAKIRTYNWPQGRVTDHRLEGEHKNHALQGVLAGDLDPILTALRMADHAERMAGGA
ncbi:MAG TPA: peptide chain release factor 1 [Rubricoccaceae bacterium]|nr:peptide chain release factor 1 [Rubricoccaceae bacterium]